VTINWRTDFMTEGWPNTHVWASVRANAQLVADMAVRLRQLRPAWPSDSDPTVEDPDE